MQKKVRNVDDELLSKISSEIGELKGIMTGIRNDMNDTKERFKAIEERGSQQHDEIDERVRLLEQQQQWLNGKLAAFVMAVGGGVTLLIHVGIWLFDKIRMHQ